MSKKKIMIVDDEVDFTKMVKLNLQKTGKYEVWIENAGANALLSAKEFIPDLILLDILMPDMEGSEVAAQLKEDRETKDIPIVFLTAVISKEEEGMSEGMIGGHPFLAKPVDLKKLIS